MVKIVRFLDGLLDRLLALLFLVILLIGIWFTYDTAYVFYHASADRVAVHRPGSTAAAAKPLSDDCVAWLHVDDTNIDYPIMQGKTNTEYLNKDPYGDYSLSGSIFLDTRNKPDFSDSYSLTYGHHMAGGLMFGALDDFLKEDFFHRHQTGTLTLVKPPDSGDSQSSQNGNKDSSGDGQASDREIPFTIFAVLETDANISELFEPLGSERALAYAAAHAKYFSDPKTTHILALTTCVDAVHTTRTVVLCALEGEME